MKQTQSAHLALFNSKNQILLVKRKDVPVWVIPGGTAEPGETPLQTALREFTEETGATITTNGVQLVAEYVPKKTNGRHKYLFTTTRKKISTLTVTSESSDFGFFDIQNLPHVTTQYEQQKIYEAYIKNTNTVLVRSDKVSYVLEIAALMKQPVYLLHLLYLYIKTKRKKRSF